jgi:hypothetical protein
MPPQRGAAGDKGLQQLGDSIHAVRRDDSRWAGRQKIRVDQRDFRHQFLVAEGLLEAIHPLHTQYRILGCFRSGARCGRYGDERGGGAGVRQLGPHAFQMIHHRIAGFEQAGDCLGGIERAAAADADHDINRLCAQGAHGLVHHLRRRLARDGKVQPRNALRCKACCNGRPERRDFQRA